MSKSFNDFRFAGLNHRDASNKYMSMDRVSEDECRIVVKVADCHLFPTAYGFGLIIDHSHVLWLKDWAVSESWYGNEVMLDKKFFNVRESTRGFDDFDDDEDTLTWGHWLDIAKAQRDAGNEVRWAK